MEEYDCNTTLMLGFNDHQNGPKRHVRAFLDQDIIESSSSLKSREHEEEIDFFKDFGRKKLRLTKDQTTLLEDSFKQHSTLNTKQALAGKLCLKPRQVEVWFQNRRARSKLKQTEVEWQLLKRNCERLSEENRRLKKEVVELRSEMKICKPLEPPQQRRHSFHVHEAVKLQKD
ncbi:homeobox-leucine zipper protein HAT14-like isoform X2 [Salvia miltiorrhiza]|uniref:homeobox-leucine zipper protein HAT14-like isoform X2 n=1 Tax=Salvia miltiorrhiza TaxID=226208 RepID=UPI0025AC984A|nr:homeobox-leucine zipper protein HAT14-like isoform X2 [Salvia miltiorrhiza]